MTPKPEKMFLPVIEQKAFTAKDAKGAKEKQENSKDRETFLAILPLADTE